MDNAIKKKVSEHINFPILLLVLAALLKFGYAFFPVFGGFRMSPYHMASVFYPFVLLVLVILCLNGKLKNGKRILGIFIMVAEAYWLFSGVMSITSNLTLFSNFLESSLTVRLWNFMVNLLALGVGFTIFKDKKLSRKWSFLYYVIAYISIILAAIAGMFHGFRISDVISPVVFATAIYNLNNLFDETAVEKTKITKKKLVILAIFLGILLLIHSALSVDWFRMQSNGSTNVCGSCGRSWEPGDPDGNYMNIAKTNLCKICEKNYHSLKEFIGE
ncbi:MAG: hypothetical protein E7598_08010 [Ruminococcaceae bacterium]|nr:hypothetical protein [Oscillospiraceae bacterium]